MTTDVMTETKTESKAPKAVRSRTKSGMTGEKVKIKLLSQEGETGDVFLALNGNALQIKRGEPVEVDRAFLHVLDDALIETVVSDFDESGRRTSKVIQMQRFPYHVLG